MTRPKFYVDLDGVIKSFVLPAMAMHGADIKDEANYPPGFQWDILGAVNSIRSERGLPVIMPPAFWDSFDYGFWVNLEMYEGAEHFLWTLDKWGDVFFATSPTLSSACVAGKYDWVKRNFRDRLRNLYIGAAKEGFAKPGAILIDDRNENVDNFIAEGGEAFLVPRAWNRGGWSAFPYDDILATLKERYA